MRQFLIFLTISIAATVMVGCGSGPSDQPESTPTIVPTPADYAAIREVDFASLAETEAMLQRLGSGSVASEAVLYTDLTGDMRQDAVVPITSGGTLGNIAYLVYTLESGRPSLILTRSMDRTTASGLVMDLDEFGSLRETVGMYGKEDPLCCPSELRLTTFRWDGAALQVAGEETVESPDKAKR